MLRRAVVVGLALVLLGPVCAVVAQDTSVPDGTGAPGRQGRGQFGGGQGGQFAGMQRVTGEVTAVAGANISIKTAEGMAYQVVTTDNTRVMMAQAGTGGPASGSINTIKVSDLKVGDGLMAAGNLDAPNKTMHAAVLTATPAAQLKALRDNLGKTYIVGKVTAIDLDDAKMTVQRTDGVSQTIGFDETTSFKRGRANLNMAGLGGGMGAAPGGGARRAGAPGAPRTPEAESITLADIKVGDNVAGQGALKGGVFTPGELTVATPGQGQGRRRAAGPGGAPADSPPAATPAAPPGPGGN